MGRAKERAASCLGEAIMVRCGIYKIIDLCRTDAGFSVDVGNCIGQVEMRLHRSGAAWADDLKFTLPPLQVEGTVATFVMPEEFWEYPLGYYDADLFQGEQFIRTVRLGLNANTNLGTVSAVDDQRECVEKPLPNTDLVTTCEEECVDGIPERCEREFYVDECGATHPVDNTQDVKQYINTANIQTNEDLVAHVDSLITLLTEMDEAGWYYSPRSPLSDEMRTRIADLKATLETVTDDVEPAIDGVVALRSELAGIVSDISRHNKVATELAARPEPVKAEPIQTERKPMTEIQKVMEKINQAFNDG